MTDVTEDEDRAQRDRARHDADGAEHDRALQATDDAERERARLAALYQLEILDTPAEKPFDDIVAVAAALCDTPIAIINFVDAERQWGKALVGVESSEAPWAASFCARTIEQADGMLVVEDTLLDPTWAHNPQVIGMPGLRFYAGAAVVTDDGHALGSLCVADNTRPRHLDGRARSALVALARQTAILLEIREQSIKLSAACGQLRSLAISDPLTGLVNRTFMEHSLWLALRQRERSRRPLGVLFADLDKLKLVNDQLGHPAGDELLRRTAERLVAGARAADLVCRYGGDEFVVMCPDLGVEDDLDTVALRLSEAVAAPLQLPEDTVRPWLSVGVAMAADGDDPDALLRRADAAMYRAKRAKH